MLDDTSIATTPLRVHVRRVFTDDGEFASENEVYCGRRLHTLNCAGSLEFIDGAAHSPRSRVLARRLQPWSGRREPR